MWGSLALVQKILVNLTITLNVDRSLCEETYFFGNDNQDRGIECTNLASSWIMQPEPDSPLHVFIAASSVNTVWYIVHVYTHPKCVHMYME